MGWRGIQDPQNTSIQSLPQKIRRRHIDFSSMHKFISQLNFIALQQSQTAEEEAKKC